MAMALSLGASVPLHIAAVMGVRRRRQRKQEAKKAGGKESTQSMGKCVVPPIQSTPSIRHAAHDREEEGKVGED